MATKTLSKYEDGFSKTQGLYRPWGASGTGGRDGGGHRRGGPAMPRRRGGECRRRGVPARAFPPPQPPRDGARQAQGAWRSPAPPSAPAVRPACRAFPCPPCLKSPCSPCAPQAPSVPSVFKRQRPVFSRQRPFLCQGALCDSGIGRWRRGMESVERIGASREEPRSGALGFLLF